MLSVIAPRAPTCCGVNHNRHCARTPRAFPAHNQLTGRCNVPCAPRLLVVAQASGGGSEFEELLKRELAGINENMKSMNQKMEGMNQKMEGMNQKMEDMNQKLEGMNQKLDRVDRKTGRIFESLVRQKVQQADLGPTAMAHSYKASRSCFQGAKMRTPQQIAEYLKKPGNAQRLVEACRQEEEGLRLMLKYLVEEQLCGGQAQPPEGVTGTPSTCVREIYDATCTPEAWRQNRHDLTTLRAHVGQLKDAVSRSAEAAGLSKEFYLKMTHYALTYMNRLIDGEDLTGFLLGEGNNMFMPFSWLVASKGRCKPRAEIVLDVAGGLFISTDGCIIELGEVKSSAADAKDGKDQLQDRLTYLAWAAHAVGVIGPLYLRGILMLGEEPADLGLLGEESIEVDHAKEATIVRMYVPI